MDSERSGRVEEFYRLALQQKPDQRDAYVKQICGEDSDLRRQIIAMLSRSEATVSLEIESTTEQSTPMEPGERLGPYLVLGPLGAGGMGRVYRGQDTRLGRAVAIKISFEKFGRRFEREAQVVSSLNHPHICTLYDIGSLVSGATYMVTELVEGETLRAWLQRSPEVDRKIQIARQVLEALRAAHGAGIVHRDLKPSNIMVRNDGYAKVLDFGLAKRMPGADAVDETGSLRIPGQIVGTVAYMSPEQVLGKEVDARSDLFAFGIILHEMLAGGHPWPRKSTVETLHAILNEAPPQIRSPYAGVVDRLLRKEPTERFSNAEEVLEALTASAGLNLRSGGLTRLIVLPFRMLRRDDSADFLAISLPDAITSSLAAIDSLVVRSTIAASRFVGVGALDVQKIAEQAHVDAILTGTILSDGGRLRVSTQMVQAPDGRLLWSNTFQSSMKDVFQLQDEMVDRIVQSLALPLTTREQRALKHDVPASAAAYEFFLRANQLVAGSYTPENMVVARGLYLQSVDADPQYAPTWACLGRASRYLAKFVGDQDANLERAEEAFQKAFRLNPDLALAHNFYTAHECDSGRALESMRRLLKRARTHHNDPNLLAGLVQACRYCGLLEASIAAYEKAKRLDPNVRTSVAYTYLQLGEFQKALELCPTATDVFVMMPSLEALGRLSEAIEMARNFEKNHPLFHNAFSVYRAALEGDYESAREACRRLPPLDDPEARFYGGCLFAKIQDPEHALELLTIAIDRGYLGYGALAHDGWLTPLRSDPRFLKLMERAQAGIRASRAAFEGERGDQVLGPAA